MATTLKLISWNVNGLRAVAKKDFFKKIDAMAPDILCLQETKAQDDQVAEVLQQQDHYHFYSNSAVRKGYSGTAIMTKPEPKDISRDIGVRKHDQEGRVLLAEYESFYLATVYVPNAGNGLVRLDYRSTWDKAFRTYLKKLDAQKPVIVCGDFNVANQEIDIARPKSNYNKTAGYTQVEIDGIDRHLKAGWIDTFRHLHPDTVAYSWWSLRTNAREKNIGWRLDYFLISKRLEDRLVSAFILPEVEGSDHCPVGMEIKI